MGNEKTPPAHSRPISLGGECNRQRSAELFDLSGIPSVVMSEALRHEGGLAART